MVNAYMIVTENRYDLAYARAVERNQPFLYVWIALLAFAGYCMFSLIRTLAADGLLLYALRFPQFYIILAMTALIAVLFILRLPFVKQRRWAKDAPVAVWAFSADKFTCDFTRRGYSSHSDYSYANVRSAKHCKGYFKLSLDSLGAVIIMDHMFREGTPDDLETLLITVLGDKYKF